MPRNTIDWKSVESYQRLLAAVVAADPAKLNYKRIADFYGRGATYDSIEGRFRIIKKDADKLKDETSFTKEDSDESVATPRRRNTKHSTDDGVISGRVTKSAQSTPTKRRTKAQRDALENSASSSSTGDFSIDSFPNNSIAPNELDLSFMSTLASFNHVDEANHTVAHDFNEPLTWTMSASPSANI